MKTIKISADKMFDILQNAGIEPNDAKAIIFDLWLDHEEGGDDTVEEKVLTRSSTPTRVYSDPVKPNEMQEGIPRTQLRNKYQSQEPIETLEREEATDKMRTPAKVRSTKRVNFGAFGGEAPPLKG